MPPNRGIYRNWGVFFDFGDSLEIAGGLEVVGTPAAGGEEKEWSLVFWTILPISYNTNCCKVLAQSIHGRGGYLRMDETGHRMGCIDEETEDFIDSGLDLKSKTIKRGWHHIGVVVNYKKDKTA